MAAPWLNDPIVGQAPPVAPATRPAAAPRASAPRSIPGTGPKPTPTPAPPSGYRWGPGGTLDAIPGGPADKPEGGNAPPSGYRWSTDGASLEAITGGPADKSGASGNATVDERRIATLLTRIAGGANDINNVGSTAAQAPGFVESVRGDLMPGGFGGVVTRSIAGSDRRTVHDAQRDILDAALTLGTGAAYNAEQLSGQMASYFPQLGDTEAEIKIKNQRLARLIEAAKVNAGPAWAQVEPAIAPFMRSLNVEPATIANEDGAATESRWPGVVGEDGKPLGPEGGYGKDPETGEWAIYGRVTDDSPPPPPAATPGAAGPGFLSQLGTSAQSAAAGAAQGVAGLLDLPADIGNAVERGTNYVVGRGGGAAMDLLGLDQAADWWRQGADRVDASLANRTGAADAIEQLSPTPEGMGASRLVAQLLGGLAVPIGPKAAPRANARPATTTAAPAREIIDAGRQNNVRVLTSDIRPPSTFTGKTVRAIGERIPYAGTGPVRAKQQEERVQAVRDLAADFGADAAGEVLDQVAEDLGKTRGARLTALSGQKNGVIDGISRQLAPTDVARTLSAIDAQVQRLTGIDATEYAPVIDRLTRFGENIASGKSLRQVEENRKLLGAMFEDATLASLKSEGQKAINSIYAPLRNDMAEFIGANAGNAARMKWSKANEELAGMAGELGDRVFRGVLNDADTTPENVAKLLFSKKPSEVRRLVGNLSPAGRARAQAAIIDRAIQSAGGIDNISPDRFANEVGRLGNSVGVVFEGADLARIKGLERLLQSTKQAGVASAAPPTGAQNMPIIGGYAAGTMFGPGAVPFLAAAGGLARAYESTMMRNLLAGLGMSKPGSTNEGRLLERILKVATSQTQIRGGAANDAVALSPSRAVASEQEDN